MHWKTEEGPAQEEIPNNHGNVISRDAPAAAGSMDVNTALKEVLKTALVSDGLVRGLRECSKALDKQVHLLSMLKKDSFTH